jgi:CheY-like chemotaxis protein
VQSIASKWFIAIQKLASYLALNGTLPANTVVMLPIASDGSPVSGQRIGVIMKLLIAEDDAFFCNILQKTLAPDHELVIAHDGNEAWIALQGANAPRLAILDWVMPGLSGPEVCRKVRASASLSSMYLIIFTARNSAADIVSGLRAGADNYLTKPFMPEELRSRIILGERVLALQNAVEMHSKCTEQAFERENALRRHLIDWPFAARPSTQDGLHEIEGCLAEAYKRSSISHFEADRPALLQAHRFLENLHA